MWHHWLYRKYMHAVHMHTLGYTFIIFAITHIIYLVRTTLICQCDCHYNTQVHPSLKNTHYVLALAYQAVTHKQGPCIPDQ